MLLIHVGGLVTYERWSHIEVWYAFLSVYDISEITLDVEIRFSAVLSGFSGPLVACVCPLLV